MNRDKIQDKWAQWMLEGRFGGDSEEQKRGLAFLAEVRDKVLQNARVAEGDVVLDVGTGDGLIGFGALGKVGERGRVIFSDISQDLLDHCRATAKELGVVDRCHFLLASADNLVGCADASVDVATTRSVLIFVAAKQTAFREFHRVLKEGGRLSIFEPINHFAYSPAPNSFWGYDVTPIRGIVAKIRAIYDRLQPATDPMVDFDERDLFSLAEKAGFGELHLELHTDRAPIPATKWETAIRAAPNPNVPALRDAMGQALNDKEIEEVTNYLRPLVETGQGTSKMARAYLWARKD